MDVTIDVGEGVTLAADLYLADPDATDVATVIEALPYRKDDITHGYLDSYLRYVAAGFAVVRVDLRGTGSSTGAALDEYPETERSDLAAVVRWVRAQPWSSGRVGFFGTSYSGFNSLHMAAAIGELGIEGLGAVVAAYATDDRYTDDVHYCGGVLRALDLIDYPLYMVAMNALPATPPANGDLAEWRRAWHERIEANPPWILRWLSEPTDGEGWRRGSIRLGPGGRGYERMACPTMLIVGWADGYRNNSFRVVEQYERNGLPWRLLAGPWVHKAPAHARPGPNIDDDVEIIAFFDQHLRGGPPSAGTAAQIYVREPVDPEPDLEFHPGRWVEIDTWPPGGARSLTLRSPRTGIESLAVVGDVGAAAWNSCAGGLPWGQPLDQRLDNARSMCVDWPLDEVLDQPLDVLGHPVVRLRVAVDRPYGHLSVKLCDVGPDGTSTLITRGMLDLRHHGCWPADETGELGAAPTDLVPGEWIDARLSVEATTWRLMPGRRLRLAIAGTDWPNCWPPPGPVTLTVDLGSVTVDMPTVEGLIACTHPFEPGSGPSATESEGVGWSVHHDVLGRSTAVETRYGGTYEGAAGAVITDEYVGTLDVSTVDPAASSARGHARFTITWPGVTVTTRAALALSSDGQRLRGEVSLCCWEGDEEVARRSWPIDLAQR